MHMVVAERSVPHGKEMFNLAHGIQLHSFAQTRTLTMVPIQNMGRPCKLHTRIHHTPYLDPSKPISRQSDIDGEC